MTKFLKITGGLVTLLILSAGVGWWAAGPQWRTFLLDPPSDTDVLFWTQDQRDTGFALSDKLPIIDSRWIEAGDAPRALPEGAPLALDIDVEAFLESQNNAGLVVLHKGAIRLERYGLHQTKDSRWTSFSVAKSMTSTLVGAAIKDGRIRGLDDKVSDYVAGLRGSAYDDVTIEQLLTMTSGVDWNEDYGDPNSDVARFAAAESADGTPAIVSYLARLPRAHPAGEVYNYSTGETNLVGVLVAAATGAPLSDYLSRKVWRPYGMGGRASWVVSKTGEEISGCCIQATARDFARFGQFILEGGMIDGAPVLPDDWLVRATRTQVEAPNDPVRNYGYQWWTMADGAFLAGGIFGQAIFIDPARDLVIASNASWRDAGGWETGQKAERYRFFAEVQKALDREAE